MKVYYFLIWIKKKKKILENKFKKSWLLKTHDWHVWNLTITVHLR